MMRAVRPHFTRERALPWVKAPSRHIPQRGFIIAVFSRAGLIQPVPACRVMRAVRPHFTRLARIGERVPERRPIPPQKYFQKHPYLSTAFPNSPLNPQITGSKYATLSAVHCSRRSEENRSMNACPAKRACSASRVRTNTHMTHTQPESFFNNLIKKKAVAFDILKGLIERKTEESQWLDFKDGGWLRTGDGKTAFSDVIPPPNASRPKGKCPLTEQLQKLWSENLGAFANSDGGILILGIRAPKRVAETLSLAPDANGLADWLRSRQKNATDPAIQGVQIESFLRTKESTDGFVVCYIPRSVLSPHRSIWAPGRYFGRFDDGNIELSAAILRRMFHPQVTSLLIPLLKFKFTLHTDGNCQIVCDIWLENKGSASALRAMVAIRPDWGYFAEIGASKEWKVRADGSTNRIFTENDIHPGETVLCGSIFTKVVPCAPDDRYNLATQLQIYSANSPAIEGSETVESDSWRDALRKSIEIQRIVRMQLLPFN